MCYIVCLLNIGLILSLYPLWLCFPWALHPMMDLNQDLNLHKIINFLTTIRFSIKLVCVCIYSLLVFLRYLSVPNALFLYPVKRGVEKGYIGNKWVNSLLKQKEPKKSLFSIFFFLPKRITHGFRYRV